MVAIRSVRRDRRDEPLIWRSERVASVIARSVD
jgi:hypothetical protein